jgi:hypothetical protein
MGEVKIASSVLFWRTDEKTSLGKSKHRWENNIEITEWKDVD